MWRQCYSLVLLCYGFFQSFGKRVSVNSDIDDTIFATQSSYSLPIDHAFGAKSPFSRKGTVMFRMSKSSSASFSANITLDQEEVKKLKELVLEDGFYMIRSPSKLHSSYPEEEIDSDKPIKYVSTFVKACYLYGSGLVETITVAVDHDANVIGLSLTSPKADCQSIEGSSKLHSYTFNSTVLVHHQVPGVVPDTQTFVKRMERQQAEEAAGKGKDNRSFLAKYWMYIVPIFLIVMLNFQGEAAQDGGGGGGSGGAAS